MSTFTDPLPTLSYEHHNGLLKVKFINQNQQTYQGATLYQPYLKDILDGLINTSNYIDHLTMGLNCCVLNLKFQIHGIESNHLIIMLKDSLKFRFSESLGLQVYFTINDRTHNFVLIKNHRFEIFKKILIDINNGTHLDYWLQYHGSQFNLMVGYMVHNQRQTYTFYTQSSYGTKDVPECIIL